MRAGIRYIIIPAGLTANSKGEAIAKPSFVYRQVLDYAINIVKNNDILYLAPANSFGSEKREHQAAYDYLIQKKKGIMVISPEVNQLRYIDTWGNALALKQHLGDRYARCKYQLICASIHSYRAEFCFKKMGFNIQSVHRVQYQIKSENIVRRLFFYKYKPLHLFYEIIAFIRALVRCNVPLFREVLYQDSKDFHSGYREGE